MFDTYLNVVRSCIKNKRLHAPICAELESHLADKKDFYTEIGYDERTAELKALEEMGNPLTVGESMAKLHKLSRGQVFVTILLCLSAIIMIIHTIIMTLSDFAYISVGENFFYENFVIMLIFVLVADLCPLLFVGVLW